MSDRDNVARHVEIQIQHRTSVSFANKYRQPAEEQEVDSNPKLAGTESIGTSGLSDLCWCAVFAAGLCCAGLLFLLRLRAVTRRDAVAVGQNSVDRQFRSKNTFGILGIPSDCD